MGIETEYAFTTLGPNGRAVPREETIGRFMKTARRELTCVEGMGPCCLFLGNGSRLYVDHGLHPELGTPECTDPWEVVRYVKAGDRILRRVAAKLESEDPDVSEVLLFRGNVDYGGTGSTWGCHESYSHQADPDTLAEEIIPHLVSRIVFAGAGGFNPFSPGLQFTLSSRAPHIVKVISGSSTHHRGIFHTKDEPLAAGGFHRLHLLCGDSLCSQKALWLMVGSTALVVRMAEQGLRPGNGLELRAPLKALGSVAFDPDCGTEVRLAGRESSTAIAIQRVYLERVEARAGEAFMPPWAEEVCRVWRETLDVLERDPREMEATLDWAIKLALYRDRARRFGVDWDLLPFWRSVLEQLSGSLGRTRRSVEPLSMDDIVRPDSPAQALMEHLTPRLKKKKLTWDDLEPLLALRRELFEIDTRFAQLGDTGIFNTLDRAGVLEHKMPQVDRIDRAVSHAPADGRAHLRGRIVRKLAGGPDSCLCDWSAVWNRTKNRVLNLSDPFETQERWEEYVQEPGLRRRRFRRDLFSLLESMGL
jgi:proteasome accessory factor A